VNDDNPQIFGEKMRENVARWGPFPEYCINKKSRPIHNRPTLKSNSAIEKEVRPYLMEGEEVYWAGRPRQGFVRNGEEGIAILSILICFGSGILWLPVGNFSTAGSIIGSSLSFLIGLFLASRMLVFDPMERSRTRYAITSERVITLVGNSSSILKSVTLPTLKEMKLYQKADRSGTIHILTGNSQSDDGPKYEKLLYQIEDVATVFELLMKLRKEKA
jgi:hypothetical protein